MEMHNVFVMGMDTPGRVLPLSCVCGQIQHWYCSAHVYFNPARLPWCGRYQTKAPRASLPASWGFLGMTVQVCGNVTITPYTAKCSDGTGEGVVVTEPCAWDLWLITVASVGSSAKQPSPSDGRAWGGQGTGTSSAATQGGFGTDTQPVLSPPVVPCKLCCTAPSEGSSSSSPSMRKSWNRSKWHNYTHTGRTNSHLHPAGQGAKDGAQIPWDVAEIFRWGRIWSWGSRSCLVELQVTHSWGFCQLPTITEFYSSASFCTHSPFQPVCLHEPFLLTEGKTNDQN